MFRLSKWLFAVIVLVVPIDAALSGPGKHFPDASETVPELITLWNESNSTCRGANGGDVKVAAACLSRSVYGVALNERNWCFGKKDESGAQMEWHACENDSLRFPPFQIESR
ncbi:MAG: hypothetical protein ACRECW_12570 [Phyllobacterium sp.]